MKQINIYQLAELYDVLLFDAFGVLVEGKGVCPGASSLIDHLVSQNKTFHVLTNDASRLPSTTAKIFGKFGLDIPAERIINSGSLIKDYFAKNNLGGLSCAVLGPTDSALFAKEAGGKLVSFEEPFDVLIIADESGFPFVEAVDAVLGNLIRKMDSGTPVRMILPNPDLIYPKGNRNFGITAGAIASMYETILKSMFGENAPRFDRLGKPYPAIYNAAMAANPGKKLLMIGDQLATDIKGAIQCGIDSALVAGGVSSVDPQDIPEDLRPTYIINSLDK